MYESARICPYHAYVHLLNYFDIQRIMLCDTEIALTEAVRSVDYHRMTHQVITFEARIRKLLIADLSAGDTSVIGSSTAVGAVHELW